MGVEYSLFLVPTPAEFLPEMCNLQRMLNTLTNEGWLPEFCCYVDSPNQGKTPYTPIRYKSRSKSTHIWRRELPSRVPRGFLSKLFNCIRKPSKSVEIEVRVPMYLEADSPFDEHWLAEQFEAEGLLLQYSIYAPLTRVLRPPLDRVDFAFGEYYYDINFAVASDFLYANGECLEGFESHCCDQCDRRLAITSDDFFNRERISIVCPHCRSRFIPDQREFRTRCPFTGKNKLVLGGPVARFLIEIDCGKCIPNSPVNFAPAFRELCEELLGCKLRQYESAQ